MNARSYEEIKKILQDRRDIKVTEAIRSNVQKTLDEFNEVRASMADVTI